MKDKEKRNKILDWIIKIVLIIIIILLLLHNCELLKRGYSQGKVPTGNVDIIEIKCDSENTCEVKPKDDDKKEEGEEKQSTPSIEPKEPTSPVSGTTEEEQPYLDGKVIVNDKDITWNGSSDIKIFTNSMYELKDKIAPESSNTYQFVVKNSTKYKIGYTIEFVENNPYHINMKYKLKRNDTYLISEYASASELNVATKELESNQNDTYYLEWKWESSSNDTEIGSNPNSFYGLKINVKAESKND